MKIQCLPALLGVIVFAGCASDSSNDTTGQGKTSTQVALAPTATSGPPTPTPTPIPPAWAAQLKMALSCAGQPKSFVLKKYGPPSPDGGVFANMVETDYYYRPVIDGKECKVTLRFNRRETAIEYVGFSFPDGVKIGDVWRELYGPKSQPHTLLCRENQIKSFWNIRNLEHKEWRQETGSDFQLRFTKISGDIKADFSCQSLEPHLKAETAFNAGSNRWQAGELKKNPDWDWKECVVGSVGFTSQKNISYGIFGPPPENDEQFDL